MVTPRKCPTPRKVCCKNICVVCKSTIKKGESRLIHSSAGKEKALHSLLLIYGDIDIIDGVICKKCERKLLNLDKSVKDFKATCQKDLHLLSSKRVIDSYQETNTKRQAPVKTLFSNDTTGVCSLSAVFENVNDSSGVFSGESFFDSLNFTPIAPKAIPTSSPKNNLVPLGEFLSLSPIVQSEESTRLGSEHSYSVNPTVDLRSDKNNQKQAKSSRLSKKQSTNFKAIENFLKTNQQENVFQDNFNRDEVCEIQSQLILNSRKALIDCLLDNAESRKCLEDRTLKRVEKECDYLKNRKYGTVSVLMTKDFNSLKTFEWDQLLDEMKLQCPFILKLFIAILIPQTLSEDQRMKRIAANIPRIGTAFAVLAQGRNPSQSKIQRIISTFLFDNICDQKVFDRLQPLGVCLSYSGGLQLLDNYAGHFNRDVIDALISGKRIRLVGDNINWKTNVNDERQDHHGKMHHVTLFPTITILNGLKKKKGKNSL